MKKIQDTIANLFSKNTRYLTILIANMRLIILVIFGILCGYLVIRVNGLVNETPLTSTAESTVTAKKPDPDVLSVFNELQSQNIRISSQFDNQRNNPF